MAGNPFTSAQAPAAMQMVAPDLAAQQTQLTRQQQLADMLRQQALEPDQGTQVINGWAVRKSPFEALGNMASALMAKSGQDKIDEKQAALGKALQGRMSDAFDQMAGGGSRASGGVTPPPAPGAAPAGSGADPAQAGLPAQPQRPRDAGEAAGVPQAPSPQSGIPPTPPPPRGVGDAAGAGTTQPVPSPQQGPSGPTAAAPQMTQADRIRAQAKAAYLMGNTELANRLLENLSTLTDQQKNDAYFGITSDQARQLELDRRKKEGYIPPTSLRGQAYTTADGQIHTLPDSAQPGYMNKFDQATGQWSTAPIQGGIESVQESEKAKTLGKTLGTIGQGVDNDGKPAYFLGLPPGTVGAPQGGQSQAPQTPSPTPNGPHINLSNMTPQEREKVMADARTLGYLRPGSTPGVSAVGPGPSGPPAPASAAGVIRPGNAPGFNDYQQGIAKAASDRYSSLVKQAQESPARVNVLDNILSLSKSGVASGPTADWNNKVKGIAADTFGIKDWKDDAAGYQELTKFMAQNASRAWQAAGGTGTDAQLSQQVQGNVNSKMFPQAVQAMAKYAKAGELALQGMTNAMQAANISDPKSQEKFEANWRQNMDPRIYQLKLMDPAEAQAFVGNLKKTNPTEYQSLMKKAQTLKQMGGL